jgi:iron(III) transport system substrate-binding protein
MSKHVIAGLAVALLAATTLSSAQAQSTVSVYTAHAPEIYNEVVPKFEAATGITVSLVQAGSGDIVQRARAEAASPWPTSSGRSAARPWRPIATCSSPS